MRELKLSLPEFAWVFGSEYDAGDATYGREILLHIPSAGIVEILTGINYIIPQNKAIHKFTGEVFGDKVNNYTAVLLNYEIDNPGDMARLQQVVLAPAAEWYCRQRIHE